MLTDGVVGEMNYKCKICGWEKKQGDYSWHTEDYDEVFKHEKSHEGLK